MKRDGAGMNQFLTTYSKGLPSDSDFKKDVDKAARFKSWIKPLAGSFLSSIYCISPIRDHNRERAKLELGEDGAKIVEQCLNLKNSRDTDGWGEFKDRIEDWLCVILGEPRMEIDFDDKNIRFRMLRGGEKKYQFFHHLGTGVAQLFILLAYLLFNKDRTLNVFLDEPENSLHSHAVAQLIRIFQNPEFAKHRFFICTHAPSLMDMVSDDWTVHKVSMAIDQGTKVVPCIDIVSKHRLLDEMGIRASHILQSNLVIWVEGPSDRQYIRAWINIISNDQVREGKHYSFAFYGGSVLKHFDFDDPTEIDVKECISLFSTSRYSCIVMDSDRESADADEKKIYSALCKELESREGSSDLIHIWQTDGREIENYVPSKLWEMLASTTHVWQKRLGDENGMTIDLVPTFSTTIEFSQYQDFAEYLCNFYEGCENFTPEGKKALRKSHDRKKVELATFMAENWKSVPASEWPWGLESQVEKLVWLIRRANGIENVGYKR